MEGFQEDICTNASAPTAQLQNLRVFLAVIAYRMWGFRVMGVSRSFLKSKPLGGMGGGPVMWYLLYLAGQSRHEEGASETTIWRGNSV